MSSSSSSSWWLKIFIIICFTILNKCNFIKSNDLLIQKIEGGGGGGGEDANNEYDLRMLSKQVKALVERRTEDLKMIEESVRKTIFHGPEVEELKDQVRSLKEEIQELRSGNPHVIHPSGTPASSSSTTKNEKLMVKWLSNAVFEIKTEITELQTTLNSSALLQDHELHKSQMVLLQSDISSLNMALEDVRTRNAKKDAEITFLKEEFDNLQRDWRIMAEINGKLRNEMKSVQLEWERNFKTLQEEKQQLLSTSNSTIHFRHQKIIRQHLIHLEKTTKILHKENILLRNRLSKLEEKPQLNNNEISQFHGNSIVENKNARKIANLTRQMTNFDKLHLSMLELLENVENLENKVDKSLPEIRKEISKVESLSSQKEAELNFLKEDTKNVKNSMQALSFSVSKLQENDQKLEENCEKFHKHLEVLEKSTTVQNSRLHDHILKEESSIMDTNSSSSTKSTIHLVEELKSFESEYKNIVNKLPRDCGSVVDDTKGIYLISPGDGEPILAHCENGWTTIQKRYDGSINFNRNWNEYSNGFGSATGEHWLGNRNLHYLTKENCTQLRINMKDIYGKYWEANYQHFHIADYTNGFKLTVHGYSGGNASDAMNYQNFMEFSTIDNDRDISNTHCASNYEGGWWFSHCQHANLNGRYNLGLTWFDSTRNEWIAVSESEMRIKKSDVC